MTQLVQHGTSLSQATISFYHKDPLTFCSLAFIASVFLLSALFLLMPLWARTRQIKNVRRKCTKLRPANAAAAETARSGILENLTSRRWLAASARDFDRKWRGSYLEDYAAAIGDFSLADFLHPANVVPRMASRQVAGVIPGILVALGILGTFLGLVQGLPALGSSSQVFDPSQLSNLIGAITKSLSLAFWTSILGISCSVSFLFFDRMLIQRIENEVQWLSDIVAAAYPILPREELDRIQLNLIKNGVDTLRHLGTDLASNLANVITPAFGKAVKTELAPTMQEVSRSLARLADLMGQTQIDSLKAIVEGAVGSMNTAMGAHLEGLTASIKTTVAAQQELNNALSAFHEQIDDSAARQIELSQRVSQAADALANSLDRLENVSAVLGTAAEQIAAAARTAEASAAAATESHRRAVEAQRELRDAVENETLSLKAAREDLVAAWNATVEHARSAISQIQEATRELGEGIGESLIKTLETFDGSAARIVSHFSGTLSQLDASIAELPPIAQALRDAGEQILSSSNASAAALEKLESLVAGRFSDTVREAMEASDRTIGAVENIQRTVAGTTALSDQLALSSQKLMEAADAFIGVQSQTRRLAEVMERIQPHFHTMEEHLHTLAGSLDGPLSAQLNAIVEASRKIEPSLSRLGALPDRILSIRESLDRLQSAIGKSLSDLIANTETIGTHLTKRSEDSGLQTRPRGPFGGLFGKK